MKKQAIKLQGRVTHVGIATAAALLELWMNRQLELTLEEYDLLVDALIELLGETRDEQWRFGVATRAATADPDTDQ